MSSAEHQHDIRFAAETIYRSAQRPPPAPHTRYDMRKCSIFFVAYCALSKQNANQFYYLI